MCIIIVFLIDTRTTFPLYKKEREWRSRAFPSDSNHDFMYLYMLRHNSLKMLLTHLCRLSLGQLASWSRDFSNRKMEEHRLNICTFNCRSIKSSLKELSELWTQWLGSSAGALAAPFRDWLFEYYAQRLFIYWQSATCRRYWVCPGW